MNAADDFRRSVEASLPPLTHYHNQAHQAPGLYGAHGMPYGWGGVSHTTATPRISFSGAPDEQGPNDAGGGYQRQTGLGGAGLTTADRNYSAGGDLREDLRASLSYRCSVEAAQHTQQPATAMYTHPAATDYGGAGGGASPRPHWREAGGGLPPRPVAAKPAEQQQPAQMLERMDASCTIQQVGSPRRYPPIDQDDRSRSGRAPLPAAPPVRPAAAPRAVGLPSALARGAAQQQQPAAPPPHPDANGGGGVQFREQVTYHRYQQHQQPYTPQPAVAAAPGVAQQAAGAVGKVVHMRRSEAWTKYIAYEGCLQVGRRAPRPPFTHGYVAGEGGGGGNGAQLLRCKGCMLRRRCASCM